VQPPLKTKAVTIPENSYHVFFFLSNKQKLSSLINT
jgi:hypothetical protein